jgi:hypothetical protein
MILQNNPNNRLKYNIYYIKEKKESKTLLNNKGILMIGCITHYILEKITFSVLQLYYLIINGFILKIFCINHSIYN